MAALLNDLVFCLEMDDASGNATDEHASRDFTENGTIGSVTGVGGSGLARDPQPSGEYFNRASESSLQVGNIDFCGSVWINPDQAAVMAIMGQYASAGSNRSWRLMTSSLNVQLIVSADGGSSVTTLTATGVLSIGSWAHIFFYHDAANDELGIIVNDGTPTTVSYSSGVYTGTADFEIARSNGGADFNGQVDQVAFWKGRVLDSDEITALYNSGSATYDYSNWTGEASATISGTAIATIDEDDITTGGKTIIITLTSDTWVASGATFDAQRQNIIDGISSAQSEGTGWNAEVRDNLAVTTCVRTSDTVVTVTLSAQSGYDITAQETITVTVPASALVTSGDAVIGSPTFTVDPVVSSDLTHWMGVGAVTDSSFRYKGRTDGDLDLAIRYSTNSDLSSSTTSTGVTTDSANDNTGGEEITGLSANTTYYYTPVVNGIDAFIQPFPSFKTSPTIGVDAPVKIAFGSCQTNGNQATIFASIAGESPNLFIHLGDFGYTDSTVLSNHRTNYKTQHDATTSDDYVAQVVKKMPVARIWDDHDYGNDNEDGDMADKANGLQAWKEYYPAPALPNASNGIWHKIQLANVDIFLLDGRYQREGAKTAINGGARFTADTGSSGTSFVIPSAQSPSASDDFYNGWYIIVGPSDHHYRVIDYVGSTRTCTLDRTAPDLTSSSSCIMAKRSILDMDFIADDQVDWLIDGINNSTARWVVICSGVAFNQTSTTGGDTWAAWDANDCEQNYLAEKITHPNVIAISGDLHISGIDDGTNGNWPEICSSPLNQTDGGANGTWSEGTDTSGHKYGLLTFETSPHQVTLASKDADGTTTASITPLVVSDAGGSSVSPNEATHAHTAESPTITQTHAITPHAATHAHTVDSPTISQVHAIAPAECLHAHTADSPTITQTHVVTPADALHAHAADSPTVTQNGTIGPDNSTHAHTVDSPTISQVHAIAPAECLHAHTADSPTITQTHVVTPADALHAHTADSPTVTSGATVSPAECVHAHSADSPLITQLHFIGPVGCLHAHAAESPAITVPSTAAADDPWIAPGFNRVWVAKSTNRVWTATGGR